MTALKLPGVTYVKGQSLRSGSTSGLTLVLGRRGVQLRRNRRRVFSLHWLALRGLDIRTPEQGSWLLIPGLYPGMESEGSSIYIHGDGRSDHLYVKETQAAVRAEFAEWVLGEAKAPRPSPAKPAPVEGRGQDGQDGPLEMVDQALGLWRAASLGRERLGSGSTLAHRLAVAEDHRDSGRLTEAVTLLESLAVQAASEYGDDNAHTLQVHNALGQAYFGIGRAEDAVNLLKATVGSAERLGGADGADTLVFRNNLAIAHQHAGQYVQAIRLHEQNISYTEQRHGPHHKDTIARRNNLAGTAARCGYRELAITGYWEVLDSLDAVRGRDPHDLGRIARQNLAILHNPSWQP